MITFLKGKVIFSDGRETVLQLASGIGYQVHFSEILSEGEEIGLHTSHIFRENDQLLYGFRTLKEKKLFQLLMSVRGVGPKSAQGILRELGFEDAVSAIKDKDKKLLSKAPGIGLRSAHQIVTDLALKIDQMKIYFTEDAPPVPLGSGHKVMEEAIMACQELGFKKDEVAPMIEQLIKENQIAKSEELVQLVLKAGVDA